MYSSGVCVLGGSVKYTNEEGSCMQLFIAFNSSLNFFVSIFSLPSMSSVSHLIKLVALKKAS